MSKLEMELPEYLKKSIRTLMLSQISNNTLDIYEIELFDWYIRETEAVVVQMLSTEREYIQEQIIAGVPDINDSGMVAVEYYTKRMRYSHIIYLTSLLETCLERACSNLTLAVGKEVMPFGLSELSGDQWSRKRKFLERYGHFELPKELWSEVQVLISVRNYLVHENGSTANVPDDQRNALNKRPGIDINGYEFKIDEAFVQHAYQAVKSFVQAVEERVGEVIQRARRPQSIP